VAQQESQEPLQDESRENRQESPDPLESVDAVNRTANFRRQLLNLRQKAQG